jgi:hypothetical protein
VRRQSRPRADRTPRSILAPRDRRRIGNGRQRDGIHGVVPGDWRNPARPGPIDGRACARVHIGPVIRIARPVRGQQLVEHSGGRVACPKPLGDRQPRPGRQERERDVVNEIGHGRTPTGGARPAEKIAGAAAPKRAGDRPAHDYRDDRGQSRPRFVNRRQRLHERWRNSGLSRGIQLADRHARAVESTV